jgi:TRL-like protein family
VRSPATALLSIALFATGCAMGAAPVIPPPALIQSYQAPLDLDQDQTQLGTKRGTSDVKTILGVVSWGDGSTRKAAENGGIATIRSADYDFFTVFGVYSRYTTIVYGD